MGNPITTTQGVDTKEKFLEFLYLLINDLKERPEGWENNSLPSFLEAAHNWVEDMDGYYINMGLPIPENINWRVFADILIAAKMYE